MPVLTCPAPPIVVQADFELPYKDVVTVPPPPTYSDNCPGWTLTWSMVRPDGTTATGTGDPSGINIYPASSRFYVGVTTITYTLVDANLHTVTCSFTVTVLAKPEITCMLPIVHDTDPGKCSYKVDPGVPTLEQGVQPITWTWSIKGPDGTIEATGTSKTPDNGPTPTSIGPYDFKVGISTITWTATNISGSDICTQTVTISDKEPPTFTPPGPFEFCVENLFSAAYVSNNLKINPDPDYYLFKASSTIFDISNINDNCCALNTIRWEIVFSTGQPTISGTGQPSTYKESGIPTDIKLWGDGITFTTLTHQIRYWVKDCNNNENPIPVVLDIRIHPRPAVTYHNQNNKQVILHTNIKKINYETNRTLFE